MLNAGSPDSGNYAEIPAPATAASETAASTDFDNTSQLAGARALTGDPDQAALAKITLLSLTTHTSGLPWDSSNIGPNLDANPDPFAKYDRALLVEGLRRDGALVKSTPFSATSIAYSPAWRLCGTAHSNSCEVTTRAAPAAAGTPVRCVVAGRATGRTHLPPAPLTCPARRTPRTHRTGS